MPAAAWAQSNDCQLDVTAVDFGRYDSLDNVRDVANGRVTLQCTPAGEEANARVTLSAGQSGHYLDRFMTSGSSRLHYNLYLEPTYRIVIGDGSAGTTAFAAPQSSTPGRETWTIFGSIPPRQIVAAGGYSDFLVLQVEF